MRTTVCPPLSQEGHELAADQAAGPGHADPQPGLAGVGGVAREIGQRALVAKAKEALEEVARRHAAEQVAGGAQRQPELDVVLDHAAVGTLGDERVRVLPRLERAVELPVAEAPPRLGVAVHRHPAAAAADRCRTRTPACRLFDVAAALDHAGVLPGWAQALERARPRVPGVDLLGGERDGAAPLEDGHRVPPASGRWLAGGAGWGAARPQPRPAQPTGRPGSTRPAASSVR